MIHFILSILDSKQKKVLFILVLLSVLTSVIEVIGIASIYPLIHIILDNQILENKIYIKYFSHLIYTKDALIYYSLGLTFLIFLIKNVFTFLVKVINFNFARHLKVDLLNKISKGYLYLPYEKIYKKTTDENIKNFNFVQDFPLVINYILLIFAESLLLIFILCFLLSISPNVLIFAFLMLFLIVAIIYKKQKNIFFDLGNTWQRQQQLFINLIIEMIGGLREIKIMGRESTFLNEIKNLMTKMSKVRFKTDVLLQVPSHVVEIAVILITIFSIFVLYQKNLTEVEIISILGSFIVALARIMPSSTRILAAINSIKYNLPLTKILFKEFNLDSYENRFKKKNKNIIKIGLKKNIILSDVSYEYASKKEVLSKISITIKKGKCIGIYGGSGVGKTTLNNLISGLLIPKSGKILVDNVDINKIDTDWNKKVSYISQKPFFINATIKQNITFKDKTKINKQKFLFALNNSGLGEFINSLPQKFNTIIGERGAFLSAGQLQRISIARTLYYDPDLIICDEATNSLDKKNEDMILRNIERIKKKGKTIIMISHNYENFFFCDEIYKLHGKKLIKIK